MNEKIETYGLAAVGAVQGVLRYYACPFFVDRYNGVMQWGVGKLINRYVDFDGVDELIAEQAKLFVPESGDQ